MMKLTALVAATPAGVIGRQGTMPWQLSSDLRRFKRLTMGGTLIMGRKTYDSIGRPLPGRETFVLTRDPSWQAEGAEGAEGVRAFPAEGAEGVRAFPAEGVRAFIDWQAAARALDLDRPAFVVGGAEIYRLWLPQCDQIYLTRVFSQTGGDTALQIPLDQFRLLAQQRWPQGARDSVPSDFEIWVRRDPA